MTSSWPTFADRYAKLNEMASSWTLSLAEDEVFAPSEQPIPEVIAAAAASIPDASAVLWDGGHLRRHVAEVGRILAGNGIGLSVGLKACANRTILAILAEMGLYADAQSPGECALARDVGFGMVTATGPAFDPRAIDAALRDGILFDVQSAAQLEYLRGRREAVPLGFRARVQLPGGLLHPSMRGTVSRFGIGLDRAGFEVLERSDIDFARVRVHTGEALSNDVARSFEYRARLGLLLRESLSSVEEINLGGGFIRLARDLPALTAAFETVGRVLAGAGPIRCWVEPGSALLLDSAYLVADVLDVAPDRHAVTIAASPWNVAPWTFPTVYVLDDEPWVFTGDVYGPALYENDRLRRTALHSATGRMPTVGDRVAVTAFGAYTLVHGRTFGQIPLPTQYIVTENGYEEAL